MSHQPLIMMQSIVNNTGAPHFLYANNAEASVTNMYKASVPILAGTDANTSPFVPANHLLASHTTKNSHY
jgi:hypothetical protein